MPEKKFYKCAEFAALCHSTKETLFHYDRLGLLRPARIGAHGYRYYTLEQYLLFEQIMLFKDAGFSLSEIQALLHGSGGARYQELLDKSYRHVRAERRRLRLQEAMLDILRTTTRHAHAARRDVVEWADLQPRRILLQPPPLGVVASLEDAVYVQRRVITDILSCGNREQLVLGMILTTADPGHMALRAVICSDNVRQRGSGRPACICAGRYATLYHEGDFASHCRAIAMLLEQLRGSGMGRLGDIYAFDIYTPLTGSQPQNWLARYAVRVSAAHTAGEARPAEPCRQDRV